MTSTITCKQLRPQSVQSGSKQFRQFLGLGNEDDPPARRKTTEMNHSKQNRNFNISLRKLYHPERPPKACGLGWEGGVGSKLQFCSGH